MTKNDVAVVPMRRRSTMYFAAPDEADHERLIVLGLVAPAFALSCCGMGGAPDSLGLLTLTVTVFVVVPLLFFAVSVYVVFCDG